MAKFNILVAVALAVFLASGAASARPKRTVVLLDFSQANSAAAPAAGFARESVDVEAMSRVMARQFTGAADLGMALDTSFQPPFVRSGFEPSGLGNPFVTHAVSTRAILPAVATQSASECSMPIYRSSSGFGRLAEERRRVIFPLVHRAACEAGLPVGLFDAMIMQESRYRPGAISTAGAFGLAQLMPGTARQLGVDRYSLRENLRGGARYLKQHVDRFGRYDLALAAYNAGPGRVERRWQVPQISETQNYVRTILENWSGATVAVPSAARPLSYRQAQMIFMAYRGSDY